MRVYWLDRESLRHALKAQAEGILQAFPEVLDVVLFGSLARGDATPRSDADLLLLVREAGPFLERGARYLPFFQNLGFPVDLLVYTPEEARRSPLAQRALEEGVVLAQRPRRPLPAPEGMDEEGP